MEQEGIFIFKLDLQNYLFAKRGLSVRLQEQNLEIYQRNICLLQDLVRGSRLAFRMLVYSIS